jgi:acyl transferase domain-containing protein/aryl carrier-like protein
MTNNQDRTGQEIAVIGMAGRFPGADSLEAFWQNLRQGVESITFFSQQELIDAGVDPMLVQRPDYIGSCGGLLEQKEYFDALFFDCKPAEAEIMDPQTRLMLQCSWHALEDAGYDPLSYEGLIGVYAGSSLNFAWEALTYMTGKTDILGEFAASLLANRDFLSTHISYRLGLRGPGVYVKTACSTSLVAVHLACQAILNGECDMALAGGAAVINWRKSGYLYQEGMIVSADGHCRAFDVRARGTVGGEGVGVVVLKRLTEALEEGDHIHAVIKGTAINNDGIRKIGYTAPSVDGQADVIREALLVADVEPESITYVETHGTGTPVGDPIEIEALKMAFATNRQGSCRLGSLKTNIGHLDAAAGIASLIKTILMLENRLIPPSLHFETPNPRSDLKNTPFTVGTAPTDWQGEGGPRRAGVSSFGIGGTNAHVIVEEHDSTGDRTGPEARTYRLIVLSARSQTALEQSAHNLAAYLRMSPQPNLSDVAYTLQVGRRAWRHRRALVTVDAEEAAAALISPERHRAQSAAVRDDTPPLVFMFPGLGGQYVNMGRELYDGEPVFRQAMDRCFAVIKPLINCDVKAMLYPAEEKDDPASLQSIDAAQAAVFIFEYALSALLLEWGIRPQAMIGYSFGEYTAACLAGVLSLEQALRLVAIRGRLIRQAPPGAMLSVPLSKPGLEPLLKEFSPGDLWLAIDNGPSCIVAGPPQSVSAFEAHLKQKKYLGVRLRAGQAMHTPLMEPILETFTQELDRLAPQPPRIPYISNVSGRWITDQQAADPRYWAAHLKSPVRFADGLRELLQRPDSIFIEIGPGRDLCGLVRHQVERESGTVILNLVDQARTKSSDSFYLLHRLGKLWLQGVPVDWHRFHGGRSRCRVPLPPYPFEGQRYWLEGDPSKMGQQMRLRSPRLESGRRADIADWLSVPTWKRSPLPWQQKEKSPEPGCWLLLADECGLAESLAHRLGQAGHQVTVVRRGDQFSRVGDRDYTMNPRQDRHYHRLFEALHKMGKAPTHVLHLWCLGTAEADLEEILDLGFYSLVYLAQAAGRQSFQGHMQVTAVSDRLHRVLDREPLCPARAALLGALKVVSREYPNIACRSLDIVLPDAADGGLDGLAGQLLRELAAAPAGAVAALRGDYCWHQTFEPVGRQTAAPATARLRERGVYLVTGGLGGIGLVLAGHLARRVQARLVLTGRSAFPPPSEWGQWPGSHEEDDGIAQKIGKIEEMQRLGAEVMVCRADVTDREQMQAVMESARQRFGAVNGVIHAAGLPDGGVIPLRTRENLAPILAPKVEGTMVLDEVLQESRLDFFVLCSSVSAVLGLFGQVAYCAANAFLDAFARQKSVEGGVFTVSINWDFWREVGMGQETVRQLKANKNISDADSLLERGIRPAEGTVVFDRILTEAYPQVVVSTWDLACRFEVLEQAAPSGDEGEIGIESFGGHMRPRPDLTSEYVAPESEFEKSFADIIRTYFGFQQVGIHDNLFEFGITSLDMIHINNALRRKVQKDIPLVVMIEYPTIHALQHYLEQAEGGGGPTDEASVSAEDLDRVQDLLHRSVGRLREQLTN